jgi:hypothetical protein
MGEGSARYGRRLSAAEYDRRATQLHDRAVRETAPSASPAEIDRRVRALETDLAIDRCLGVEFPSDRRRAVLQARTRVEERRSRLAARLLAQEISPTEFASGMQGVVDQLVDELSSILAPEEVKALLGIPALDAATLPLDPTLIDVKEPKS